MGGGDDDAFAALYDRHCRLAYSVAHKLTGEKHSAEDLAQEVFIKVWRSAQRYRPERGSVRTWILSVVRLPEGATMEVMWPLQFTRIWNEGVSFGLTGTYDF